LIHGVGSGKPQKLKWCVVEGGSSVLEEDGEEEERILWHVVGIFGALREVVTALLSMLKAVKSGCVGFWTSLRQGLGDSLLAGEGGRSYVVVCGK
jgi:hypothetical protein